MLLHQRNEQQPDQLKNCIRKYINYRKQVDIVIFYRQHTVPREKSPIAKKPADHYCCIFSLLMPKNLHEEIMHVCMFS